MEDLLLSHPSGRDVNLEALGQPPPAVTLDFCVLRESPKQIPEFSVAKLAKTFAVVGCRNCWQVSLRKLFRDMCWGSFHWNANPDKLNDGHPIPGCWLAAIATVESMSYRPVCSG